MWQHLLCDGPEELTAADIKDRIRTTAAFVGSELAAAIDRLASDGAAAFAIKELTASSLHTDVLGGHAGLDAEWNTIDPVTGETLENLVAGVVALKQRLQTLVAAWNSAKDREEAAEAAAAAAAEADRAVAAAAAAAEADRAVAAAAAAAEVAKARAARAAGSAAALAAAEDAEAIAAAAVASLAASRARRTASRARRTALQSLTRQRSDVPLWKLERSPGRRRRHRSRSSGRKKSPTPAARRVEMARRQALQALKGSAVAKECVK
jgi:hypothetical protein